MQDREALADPCLKAIGDSEAKISLHNNLIALLAFCDNFCIALDGSAVGGPFVIFLWS